MPGAAAESECMACPAGKFGGREGSSTCIECEAGKVSDRGEVVCRPKDDDVVTGMAKDVLTGIITSVILAPLAIIGTCLRNKISARCWLSDGQSDQNQQPHHSV